MLETVMHELVSKYAPDWVLTMPSVNQREPSRVELRGALPTTLNFGSARLALDTGVIVFIVEDHMGGGDFEERTVTLTADELERVRVASRLGP